MPLKLVFSNSTGCLKIILGFFFQYVCGNWAREHPRPDAFQSFDWFRDKQSKVYATVRDFLNTNATNQPLPVKQAKDLYAACMDTGNAK